MRILVVFHLMKNLLRRWKALWYPERYHGWGRKKSYFEGWYFKMVSKDESLAFSLIPGISMDVNGKSHSFIQMIDGTEGKTFYESFPSDQFETGDDRFFVKIGDNYFDNQELRIQLPQISGNVRILNPVPWPGELGAPGVMGWYSFVPMMQCYHGVVSMNHDLEGTVEYNGRTYDLNGGLGYIEKDWGSSFPRCWIWMQTNHFNNLNRETSFMASVAHIPWMGSYFIGFLVAFWLDDHLYRFTTYNGSRMRSAMDDEHVYLMFTRKNWKLKITATKGHTGELVSPIVGEMTGKVSESIAANVQLELYEDDRLIYEGAGRNAGLEVAGDVSILLTDEEGNFDISQ